MTESSDPLLLSKKASKLVKGGEGLPGTLLITQSKVKWNPDDKTAAKGVVIEISSITKQQQAPGKPFLRIISSGEPLGLAFPSDADKEEVLDLMKQLKPAGAPNGGAGAAASATGIPTPAEQRRILAADKDLEALYGQLVRSGILSDADFWRARQKELAKVSGRDGARGSGAQRAGLSSVMHEVERLHDGQTERVNIQLTPADIQRIFLERPEVHRAYMANVPHALPEKDFWQQYFKLEYKKAARRKRLAAAGRIDVADDELDEGDTLFAPFRRQLAEQETAQAKAKIKAVDPGVNIAADFGEQWGGGGFGSLHGGAEGSRAQSSKPSTALDSIARELNRHAAQVLDGTPAGLEGGEGSDEGTAAIAARVAAAVQAQSKAKGGAAAKNQAEADAALAKEWQARAVSGLEDLSLHAAPDVVPLHIQDPRAYFGGSGADAQPAHGLPDTDKSAEADGFVKNKAAVSDMLQRIHARALANPPCDTAAAAAALLEVGRDEDETLVAEFGEVASMAMGTAPEKALGSVMVEFFRLEALKTNEMLRHFWGCLPLASEVRRAKAARLAPHLEDQKNSLAVHMASRKGTVEQVYITQMVQPLVKAITAALTRYRSELAGRTAAV